MLGEPLLDVVEELVRLREHQRVPSVGDEATGPVRPGRQHVAQHPGRDQRVGGAAQTKAMKKVSGSIKLELAQHREMAAFAQFGSDLDSKTKAQLERGARVVELFKQTAFNPIPVEVQSSLIYAVQNGFFDAIAVANIVAATSSLREFLETRGAKVMDTIRAEQAISDATEEALKASLAEWVAGFSA